MRVARRPQPAGESGRRIAFFATATDAAGLSLSLPIAAEKSGVEYASAFVVAAGLAQGSEAGKSGLGRAEALAILEKYSQYAVFAYDPEGSKDSFVMGLYPKGAGPSLLQESDVELAQLGAWRP